MIVQTITREPHGLESARGDAITSELRLMTGVFSTGSPYAMTVTDCYLWSMTPTPTP